MVVVVVVVVVVDVVVLTVRAGGPDVGGHVAVAVERVEIVAT